MQDSLPAGWLAFAGREFNPLDQIERFQSLHLIPLSRAYPDASWAHVRRKFYDIQVATNSAIATEAVERIGALYEIEREIRGKPPATRCEVRQARARPLVNELHGWLNTMLMRLSRKSDTAMAIRYALARWRALSRYLDDGLIEIDNSAAERALRAVALDAKTISSVDPMPADMLLRRFIH